MKMIENFEGYILDLNVVMIYLGYHSEEEYIYDCRSDVVGDGYIYYTDLRDENKRLLIKFDVLEDWSQYASPYIKVTSFEEVF